MSQVIVSSHLGENIIKQLQALSVNKSLSIIRAYLSDPDLSMAEINDLVTIRNLKIGAMKDENL